MSNINKAVASLARKDIGFRRVLLASLGIPMKSVPSPLREKMASGLKLAKGGVVQQTMDAFADANTMPAKGVDPYTDPAFLEAMKKRKMKFRGRQWLAPRAWADLMAKATPNGYNDFNPKKVLQWLNRIEKKVGLPGKLKVQPAREYSVAAYVTGPQELLEAIVQSGKRRGGKADENYWDTGKKDVVRLWWD